jgi:hypothetical protein
VGSYVCEQKISKIFLERNMFSIDYLRAVFSRRLSISTKAITLVCFLFIVAPATSHAAISQVEGGTTSVLFGNGALETLGLEITAISSDVIVPGNLGPSSVAFGINSRDEMTGLPTTFQYDSTSVLPVSGRIEHTGTIQFNGSIDVGNFTVALAPNRPAGTSGFVVASNFGLMEIIFDIAATPISEPFEDELVIAGDILVSPELALALGNTDFAGVDAGAALIVSDASIVPIPAAAWLFGSALLGFMGIARRKQK